MLGVVWVLFAWSVLGNVLRLVLLVGRGRRPGRAPGSSAVVAAVVAVGLLRLGLRRGDAGAPGPPGRGRRSLGSAPGLDGLQVVLLTDTHYGPIDRARWSARVAEVVNALDADIVCHTGDIADGTVAQRRAQAAPLGDVRARLARAYVTGNHEYFGEAEGWLDHMARAGLGAAAQPAPRGRARRRPARRRRRRRPSPPPAPACRATAPTTPPRWPAPTRTCRCCCWPTSPSRSATPSRTASTCSCPGTPTAARSGRSTPGPARPAGGAGPDPARRRAPSSTPAGAPASGARRSGSSRRARSPCSPSAAPDRIPTIGGEAVHGPAARRTRRPAGRPDGPPASRGLAPGRAGRQPTCGND